jgi:hypothetical protein
MRSSLAAGCIAAAMGVAVLLPGVASAAPPRNDNYLASTTVTDAQGGFPSRWRDTQNTVEATTQPDLFDPDRDGAPLGGGPPETTQCEGASYGKTVWYDLAPPLAGAVELTASGFDTVIAVYEYEVETAKLLRQIACLNETAGTSEDLALPADLQKGHAYTVQIGGVQSAAGIASGTLDFGLRFHADRDGDGVYDAEPDGCLELPGIAPSGCPPELKASPRYRWSPAGSGIRLDSLTVKGAPSGGRIEARCRKCRLKQVVTVEPGASTVRLSKFVGPTLPLGVALEIRVTKPAAKSGRYRHGAIGNYFRYTTIRRGLSERLDRCLLPGSDEPKRKCT